MAADGSIRIVTRIDITDAKLKLKQLQQELARADKAIETAQKNLAKNASKMAAYNAEKQAITESTNVELSRAETEEQVNNVLAIEQAQLEALNQKYASVLERQRQQEAILEEARRTQAGLTTQVQEQQGVVRNLTVEQERQAQEVRETAQAEREHARAVKETERASNKLAHSADRVSRKIRLWGTAMLGVRGVIGILRKSVNAFLNDNENVANQLTSIWSAIGNALGPIIQRIINLIQTLFSAVASFVKALTGIDIIANANAKALENQADATAGAGAAAEKAERQLASFDEQNKLSDTSSSGGGGGGGSAEITNLLDSIDNWLTRFAADLALTFKDVFLDWGDLNEEQILEKIVVGLSAITGGVIGFVIGGPGGAAIGILVGAGLGLLIATTIFDHDGKLSTSEVLSSIMTVLGGMVGGAIGFAIVSGPVGAAIGITVGAILTLALMDKVNWENFDLLQDHEVLDESQKAVTDYSQGVGIEFGNLISNLTGGFDGLDQKIDTWADNVIEDVESAANWFKEKWENLTTHLNTKLDEMDQAVDTWADNVLETISTWASNAKAKIQDLIATGKAKFEEFKTNVVAKFQTIKQKVSDVFQNVKQTITDAIENAKSKFNDLKEKVLSVWETVKSKFTSLGSVIGSAISGAIKTAINNVLSLVESKINSAVSLINSAISLINKLPGVSVNYLSSVSLPRLAKGGVVNNPGRGVPAVIGEAGAEAVLPLERNTEWMDILADKINSNSGQVTIPIYLSGKQIAKYVVDLNKRTAFATNNA